MELLIRNLVLLIIIAGCSQTVPSRSPTPVADQVQQSDDPKEIIDLGIARTTADDLIDFSKLEFDALVFVFASDTCITCAEEVAYWKSEFSKAVPKNIYFAHFIIGGSRLDALDWKSLHQLSWDVFYDPNDQLYRQYCPRILTPCFLILDRVNNKLIQTYKVFKKEDIEGVSTPWVY